MIKDILKLENFYFFTTHEHPGPGLTSSGFLTIQDEGCGGTMRNEKWEEKAQPEPGVGSPAN